MTATACRLALWLMLQAACLLARPAHAAELLVAGHAWTTQALLARPDAATIEVPADAAYGRRMTYRAVPLRALLPGTPATLEARAADGFVSQLPAALLAGPATPWLAVEDPVHPWPPVPGKPHSAGPFYLVWRGARVPVDDWPYALASLTQVDTPDTRWPSLRVAASLPATAPARRGAVVFASNCLPCHKLAGAGEGTQGPDLLRPMPATAYLTGPGLRALIRNPKSVRNWPAQQMPAFPPDAMPDSDIAAVIAYLRHLAAR